MVKIFPIGNISIRKRFVKLNNNILNSLKKLLYSENELYELNKWITIQTHTRNTDSYSDTDSEKPSY